MEKVCIAVDAKKRGYVEAIVEECSKIKSRLDYYKRAFKDKNSDKKIYKLQKVS